MRTAIKIIAATTLAVLSLFITALGAFFIITADATLQPHKLVDYTKTIAVFDDQSVKIEDASLKTKQKSVKIEDLSEDTKNAFIASEDRKFYSHNGLNYKRMVKAAFKNLAARSFKEGASTISQQLIKNTHLSSDKTITRKLKEIKLTKQLERRYSKDRILEMYLNTIYFGHNCFGLQNASEFYFGKTADKLTLEESATLAGLLTSPNNYSPVKNPQKSVARRNTVLKSMRECGFIDGQTYEQSVNSTLTVKDDGNKERLSGYLNGVFDEFEQLDIDPYGQFGRVNIMTYLNRTVQNSLENLSSDCDFSYLVRSNNGGIVGYASSIGLIKRQIGSAAKPIFVYAPALNERKIDTFTRICDEPINYGGYSPENYDKKYHGMVTVTESIMKSYNIPAVKTLNGLDLDKIQEYAGKMGVNLKNEDKNLSLALGGMSDGLTLKELVDCYSVFPNGGIYTPSGFIKEIQDENGKVLYSAKSTQSQVFCRGTCSLINDTLCRTAKEGTAKKLKDFNFDVACKTGTCGTSDGNTDAYAAGFTSDYSFGIWLGDKNNAKKDITGGKDCCNLLKSLLSDIYRQNSPAPLDKTTGTKCIEIDREEYENDDKIRICDDNCPKINRLSVRILSDSAQPSKSTRFTSPTIKKPAISVKNNQIDIQLCQTKYYSYLIRRLNNGKIDIIYEGLWKEHVTDTPPDGEYEYSITPIYSFNGNEFKGEEIVLPRIIIRNEKQTDKVPDIAYKDWFNQ